MTYIYRTLSALVEVTQSRVYFYFRSRKRKDAQVNAEMMLQTLHSSLLRRTVQFGTVAAYKFIVRNGLGFLIPTFFNIPASFNLNFHQCNFTENGNTARESTISVVLVLAPNMEPTPSTRLILSLLVLEIHSYVYSPGTISQRGARCLLYHLTSSTQLSVSNSRR